AMSRVARDNFAREPSLVKEWRTAVTHGQRGKDSMKQRKNTKNLRFTLSQPVSRAKSKLTDAAFGRR
ncbi:MAG: hypothetical protein ACRED1_04890, partial [Limisphaerales bacterium]